MDAPQNFAMPKEAFTIFEPRLAHRLGISRDEARALRQAYLKKGVHWDYVSKKAMLTAEAELILREKMALPRPDAAPEPEAQEEAPATPGAPAPRLLLPAPFKGELIAYALTRNDRILMAYLPGTDPKNARALVRVL